MHSSLTLWHVTCGHSHENGCYGYESANNEIASGDSGSRRNYQSAPTAPEAWSISCSTSLARDPYHWRQAETDHRRRYARPSRYSASRKDRTFASRSSSGTGCAHNRYRHGNSGCSVTIWPIHDRFFPPRFPRLLKCSPHFGDFAVVKSSSLIEDRSRLRLAQFEAVTSEFPGYLNSTSKPNCEKKYFNCARARSSASFNMPLVRAARRMSSTAFNRAVCSRSLLKSRK